MRRHCVIIGLLACLGAEGASAAQRQHSVQFAQPAPTGSKAGRTFVDEHGVRADCSAPEFHSLDYMIGEWDAVETKSGKHFLYNRVEAVNGGCAVSETLLMRDNVPGSSLNFYSATDKRWHSFYHSPTLYAVLEGQMDDGGRHVVETHIVLPGSKSSSLVRQITSRDSRGRPRQVGIAIGSDGSMTELWDLTFCATAPDADRSAPCDKRAAAKADAGGA